MECKFFVFNSFFQIEAPIDTQIVTDPTEEVGAIGDGEIISAKELYAKFMSLVETKRITHVYPNANKKQEANYNKDDDDISV